MLRVKLLIVCARVCARVCAAGACAAGLALGVPAQTVSRAVPSDGSVPGAGSASELRLAVLERGAVPVPEGALAPVLAAGADDELVLAWLERDGPRARLGHAVWRDESSGGGAWSAPAVALEGADWFVNWADVPALAALADGTLAATFLPKSGAGTYAYDAYVAVRPAGAARWSAPRKLHTDGVAGEHGFVSLVPLDGAAPGFAAVWLDGRATAAPEPYAGERDGEPGGGEHDDGEHGGGEHDDGGHGGGEHGSGAMTLRARRVHADGTLGPESLLDARVCDCCPTAATRLGDGRVLVLYRDRSRDEVRDVAFVVGRVDEPESWSAPRLVHADGWTIPGCPVNGPSVDARAGRVAAAWFTAAQERSRVLVAFAADERGAPPVFGAPVRVDGDHEAFGDPHGRVELALVDGGRAVLVWLGAVAGRGVWRARVVAADGRLGPTVDVAETDLARSAGRARLVARGREVTIVWPTPEGLAQARLRAGE